MTKQKRQTEQKEAQTTTEDESVETLKAQLQTMTAEKNALSLAFSESEKNRKLSKEERENLKSECLVKTDRSVYLMKNVNATAIVFEKKYKAQLKAYAKDVLKTSDEKLTLSELNSFIETLF